MNEEELFAKFGAPPVEQAVAMNEDELFSKFGVSDEIASNPAYANGLTPQSAVNKSPLTATERFQIKGLGNREADVEASLKKRFSAVERNEDGAFVVKADNGVWHQIDPDTLGERDAIDVTRGILRGAGATVGGLAASGANLLANTFVPGANFETNPLKLAEMLAGEDAVAREFVGEAAENVDTAAMTAGGLAVAPVTAGATLASVAGTAATAGAVSGLTKIGLTSLGRLQGTYNAPVEEQLKDASYEAALGLVGTFIPAGVRFGLNKFSSGKVAAKATEVLSKAPEEQLPVIRAFFKDVVDDVSFDRIVTPGNQVQEFIDQSVKVGKDLTTFQDHMRLGMIDDIQSAAKSAISGLSDVYTNKINKIAEEIPDDLVISAKKMLAPLYDDLIVNEQIATRTKNGGIKLLPFEELAEREAARGLGETGKAVAFDRKTYNELSKLVETMDRMDRGVFIKGKEAFKEALADQKILKTLTKDMQAAGKTEMGDIKNGILYRVASKYGEQIKNALPDALPTNLGTKLRNANTSYKSLKGAIEPLEKAFASDKEALRLASAMTGRTAAGTLDRALMPNVVKEFTEYGGVKGIGIAKQLMTTADRLADRKAAIQFTAPMRAQLSAFQAGAAAQSAANAIDKPGLTAISSLGWSASLISRYPKAAKASVDASLKLTRMLEAGTKRMTPIQRANFLFNGDNLEKMSRIVTSGLVRAQTQEQLMSQIPGANGGQQ